MKNTTVHDCRVIELEKHSHNKGNITVAENNSEYLPFAVKRVYYLYDIPSGENRGGHAHYELRQLLMAASGSFDVILDDGRQKRKVTLKHPNQGLLIVPGLWREIENFSSGSVCLVLASEYYAEADYIRDYNEFLAYKNE